MHKSCYKVVTSLMWFKTERDTGVLCDAVELAPCSTLQYPLAGQILIFRCFILVTDGNDMLSFGGVHRCTTTGWCR